MTARGYRVVASFPFLFAFTAALPLAPVALGQDAPAAQVDIENSKFQAVGSINANDVFVRSGPSENDYSTTKLKKDAQVTVVGERFNWLKIVPPEGSFCLVAKAYVNKVGNGTVGVVTSPLNVRVGSDLNNLKTKTVKTLENNARVEIIGEQDEYFKIKPPSDVFYYVNKQFVDLVKVIDKPAGEVVAAPLTRVPEPGITNAQRPTTGPSLTFGKPEGTFPDKPATQPGQVAEAAKPAPTTQGSATAEAAFEQLEVTYAEITQKPLIEQPVDELLSGYKTVAANSELPESLRRIAEWKINILKTRAEAKLQLAEVKKTQEVFAQKQMATRAEQAELEQRVKQTDLQFFTAVGTLRTSSLQTGQQVMYRLTDPANGRTVVYLRSSDAKLGNSLGEFIGVKGNISTDAAMNMRTVAVDSFSTVNPAKIGQSIVSQICPPSMLPGTASSGD